MSGRAGRPPRLAVLALESLANGTALRRLLRDPPGEVVLLGLSDPYRRSAGGAIGQLARHLRRSGPGFLGYLAVNMSLPRLAAALPGRTGLAGAARAAGVPVTRVADVNGPAFRAELAASGAEMILSFHFDQILSAATLAAVPRGGVNVHPSLLPHHRGPVPTFWAGLEPEIGHGVTVHRMVPRIDAGGVLARLRVALPAGTTASAAARLLHEAALPLLPDALREAGGAPPPEPARPYRPFPSRAEVRAARRRGLRLWDAGDLRAALASGRPDCQPPDR